jgi:hypothetical protein
MKQIGGHFSVRLSQKVSRHTVGEAFSLFSEQLPFMRDTLKSRMLMRVCRFKDGV